MATSHFVRIPLRLLCAILAAGGLTLAVGLTLYRHTARPIAARRPRIKVEVSPGTDREQIRAMGYEPVEKILPCGHPATGGIYVGNSTVFSCDYGHRFIPYGQWYVPEGRRY